jgi:hypothetical protein
MGPSFETFEFSIDLVPLESSAVVADVTGNVTMYSTKESRKQHLERGAAVEIDRNITISPGGRLLVRLATGEEREFTAPADEARTLSFKDAAEMRKPLGNFYLEQLKGFKSLLEKVRAGFPQGEEMMLKWTPRHSRDEALEMLDSGAAALVPQALADELGVIPLRAADETVVVAATHWTASKCITFLEAVKRPFSPALLDPDVFAELRTRVYGA